MCMLAYTCMLSHAERMVRGVCVCACVCVCVCVCDIQSSGWWTQVSSLHYPIPSASLSPSLSLTPFPCPPYVFILAPPPPNTYPPASPQVVIQHIDNAAALVDHAISEAMRLKKPAYIEVGATACTAWVCYCLPACMLMQGGGMGFISERLLSMMMRVRVYSGVVMRVRVYSRSW